MKYSRFSLPKTTTFNASSRSISSTSSANSATICAPMMFKGGLSMLTRQYSGDSRLTAICLRSPTSGRSFAFLFNMEPILLGWVGFKGNGGHGDIGPSAAAVPDRAIRTRSDEAVGDLIEAASSDAIDRGDRERYVPRSGRRALSGRAAPRRIPGGLLRLQAFETLARTKP